MSLKNIIYIDYEKVYSLSSQLFEGITQSALQHKESTLSNSDAIEVKAQHKSSESSDTQKLSTIINPHDYHYLKFEEELYSRGIITDINTSIPFEKINPSSFVKVKCQVQFNDYEKLKDTSKRFAEISYAINYVHKTEDIDSLAQLLKELKPKSSEYTLIKQKQSELMKELDDLVSDTKKKFFDKLSLVLDYAYGTEIEISQELHNVKFTSFLIREFLKTSPEMFVKRHSRRSASEFSVVGIITRPPKSPEMDDREERIIDGIRSAAWNMNDALFDLESTFCAPDSNEYFIEPIALYHEL